MAFPERLHSRPSACCRQGVDGKAESLSLFSSRLSECQPVLPRLGMKMRFGEFETQLVRSGEQLARHPDKEGANRLRLPAFECGIGARERHPTQRVIGQDGTLEECGVGEEAVGLWKG